MKYKKYILHFQSFLNTEMAQVVEVPPFGKQRTFYQISNMAAVKKKSNMAADGHVSSQNIGNHGTLDTPYISSPCGPSGHRGVVKVHWRVPWVGGSFSWVVATFTL